MSNGINWNPSVITFYTSSGMQQINYKDADENTQRMWDSLQNRTRPPVDLQNMGLHALSVADMDKPIMDMLTLSNQSKTAVNPFVLTEAEPFDTSLANFYIGSPTKTVNFNGREFYLYDSENEKYLNDPNVRVSETGYLLRQTSGSTQTLNGTVEILGRAVDAPENVKPKYTADFFSASPDSILRAALEYSKTGAYEANSKSQYGVDNLVSSIVDFFGAGKATQADYDKTKESIESIIKELAEVINNGTSAGYTSAKSKIDIMGKQVSLAELVDMHKYGSELSNQLIGENREWLMFDSNRVGEFAHRGIVKSIGMSYGDQIGGDAGELFKSAWGAEVDRHSEIIKNSLDNHYKMIGADTTSLSILKNGADYIYDVFSKIDTSSKENALKSFKDLSGEIDAAINKFYGQYIGGVPGGLAEKMRAEVNSYFYNLMGFKSVNVTA